jgi:tetratricopeptide (TPR) repeat protein/outer membrane protein assembly factor BamB
MDLITLLQNQIEKGAVGTLVLGKRSSFRELFLEKGSIYLCDDAYSGRIDMESLCEAGVLPHRISPSQLENVLRQTDLKKTLLPHALADGGFVDDAAVQSLATRHLREEMLRLLIGSQDSFSFQKGRVPERLLTPQGAAPRLPIEVAQLRGDLEKRVAEMKEIDDVLPSRAEVFVVTADGMMYKQEHPEDVPVQMLFDLIDGFRSLECLLATSVFFEHFLRKLVRRCLEQEFLKKRSLPELRDVDPSNFSEDEARRHLPAFKSAVRFFVDQLAARERLAIVHEKLGNVQEAVVQYNYIGDALYRMRKPAKAIKAYQRALVVKPDELLVSDKINRIYQEAAKSDLERGEVQQAIQLLRNALRVSPGEESLCRLMAEALIADGNVRELAAFCDHVSLQAKQCASHKHAREVLTLIATSFPNDALLKKKLVNVFQDLGDDASAVNLLKDLTQSYLAKGESDRALEMLNKIERMGKLSEELSRLQRDLRKEIGVVVRRQGRRTGLATMASVLAVILAAYQVWGYILWLDIEQSSVALASSSTAQGAESPGRAGAADRDIDLLTSEDEERQLAVAKRCARFVHRFPISLLRANAERLYKVCTERAQHLSGLRANRKDQLLRDAKLYLVEGDHQRAEEKLKPLLALPDEHAWKQEALTHVDKLRSYDRSSQDYFEEGRRHEREEDWQRAYAAYHKLLDLYPQSQLAKEVQLPVFVESVPSTADIFLIAGRQEEPRHLGTTPRVFRLKPGHPVEVELRAPGHYPLQTTLHESDGPLALFLLHRQDTWSHPVDANMVQAPVFFGDHLVCAYENGKVEALEAGTRAAVWNYSRESVNNLVNTPLVQPEGLYTVWNDRKVLLLPPRPGSAPPTPAAEAMLEGLAATPLVACGAFLAIGTSRGALEVLSRSTLQSLHRHPLPWQPAALEALGGATVVAGDAGGRLLGLQLPAGTPRWQRDCGGPLELLRVCAPTVLAVATANGRLLFLNPDDGAELRPATELGPRTRALADPHLGLVYLVDPDGTVTAVDVEQGKTIAQHKLEQIRPSASFVLRGGLAVVHREGRNMLVLDGRSLKARWAVAYLAEILQVASDEARVAVSTREGRVILYAGH